MEKKNEVATFKREMALQYENFYTMLKIQKRMIKYNVNPKKEKSVVFKFNTPILKFKFDIDLFPKKTNFPKFSKINFPKIDFCNHYLTPDVSKIAEITSAGESHIGACPVSGKIIHLA